MKIIHLNYSDNIGGAAKAAFRIHQSLIKEGYESLNPSTGGSGGSRVVSATSGGPSGGSGL